MNFDLTPDQAASLSSAAHLVMEYLPVTDRKRKALSEAQQALYKFLKPVSQDTTREVQQVSATSEREYRGLLIYTYGYLDTYSVLIGGYPENEIIFHSPEVLLTVYYDRSCEDVAMTLSFDGSTFPVEDKGDDYDDEGYERPFPDVAWFSFPVWYGASVHLTIFTPIGRKEASFLLTKKGIEEDSQSILIDIENDCPSVTVK